MQQEDFSFKSLFSTLVSMMKLLPASYKWRLLLLLFLQISSSLLEVISISAIIPFLNALADVDSFVTHPYVAPVLKLLEIENKAYVIGLASGFFALAICCSNFFKFVVFWYQRQVVALMDVELGTILYEKILHKPYRFFLGNNSSDLIGNLTHDRRAAFGALNSVLTLMTYGLLSISIVSGLLLHDPASALSLLGICLGCYTLVAFSVRQKLHNNSTVESKSYQSVIKTMQESFNGIRYIILENNHRTFTKKYKKDYYWQKIANANSQILREFPRYFVESIGAIAICSLIIIYAFASSNVNEQNFLPLLGLLAMSSLRLVTFANQCYNSFSNLMATSFSLHQVVKFLRSPEEFSRPSRNIASLPLKRELNLKNISFQYDKNSQKHPTLSHISFTIKEKSTLAIVGSTGSGKSTLSDIILGLIHPDSGDLIVDGQKLGKFNMINWQKGIAHVPQHIFMADTSLLENIALGIPTKEIDIKWAQEVAKQAQIHQFILTLPNQYNTLVGERGVRLSGGQIQRIGIARALYKRPHLIVFDEATSALDTETETMVMESIANISKEQTLIIIAHRLSTVKNADTILLLKDGRLLAQGTYNELLKNSIIFHKLVKRCGFFEDRKKCTSLPQRN